MNCSIEPSNLKLFVKVLQALSKMGNELCIEAFEDHLLLRTVNAMTTGFAVCKLYNTFFRDYKITPNTDHTETIICKVLMKSILGVFKNPHQMEKLVLQCTMEFTNNSTELIFKFDYKYDAKKLHKIFLSEGSYLQIVPPDINTANIITGTSSLFTQILANFLTSDDEITFDVTPNTIFLRNYYIGEKVSYEVRSQFSLSISEFRVYSIEKDYQFTFHMKPLRACVHLADYIHALVTIKFQTPGMPIVVSFSKSGSLDVYFTMATLTYDDVVDSQTSFSSLSEIYPVGQDRSKRNRADRLSQLIENDSAECPEESSHAILPKQGISDKTIKEPVKANTFPARKEQISEPIMEKIFPITKQQVIKEKEKLNVKKQVSHKEMEEPAKAIPPEPRKKKLFELLPVTPTEETTVESLKKKKVSETRMENPFTRISNISKPSGNKEVSESPAENLFTPISINSESVENDEISESRIQNALNSVANTGGPPEDKEAYLRFIFARLHEPPKEINETILAPDSNSDSDST